MMRVPRPFVAGAALALCVIGPSWSPAQQPSRAAQPLKSGPLQVDADGAVYVVNPDSDSVTRLAAPTNGVQPKVWEGPSGDYPRTLTLQSDFVITANQTADTLSRLRKSDGAREGPDVPLGFGCAPYGIAGNHAGDRLYVSCQGTQELLVLDASLTVLDRIRLDWAAPRALAVTADDQRIFVSHFLTVEPNDDAHVSEVLAATNALSARRFLTIPPDRATCETQNSGQGVTNLVNVVALTPPDSPAANQLWVGGALQNVLTKGLFKRFAGFANRPEMGLFTLPCPTDDPSVSCRFESFPRGNDAAALERNLYKAFFHDINRLVIWKLDVDSGRVLGKIDIDDGSQATDLAFSRDGSAAYVVDQAFNGFNVFNVLRGQDGNPATVANAPAAFGPFSADPTVPCTAEALDSVVPEGPFRIAPQARIMPSTGGDPIRLDAEGVPHTVATGIDFDTRRYHETGVAAMRDVADAIGTAPIGVALSPDGCVAYVANYLARKVVAVSARPGVAGCSSAGQTVDFRCSNDLDTSCGTGNDCSVAGGFCNHPGGTPCASDLDCLPGPGPCLPDVECVPLLIADAVASTATVSAEIPAEILDGKILFNTAARDGSLPNGLALTRPAPFFNTTRRACADDPDLACLSDADCDEGPCVVVSLPGEVLSTSHAAGYVSCTSCHPDYGGQDGRTWDFSQFGASLRNTMDLRGRSQAAPGTCDLALAADATRAGTRCHFDAECGAGSGPGACVAQPGTIPAHLVGDDRRRYFNPMLTVHWNGDRMEVEGFEFTYRQLLGASDCDGFEHDPAICFGALVPRSLVTATAAIPQDGRFEGDLASTLRNLMVEEPTLAKPVNASVRLTHLADFVYSLMSFSRNPFRGEQGAAISAAAQRGRRLFNDASTGCAACHNGPSPEHQLFTDKGANGGFDAALPPGAARNNLFRRHAVGTANVFDRTDPAAVAAANASFQNPVGSESGRGIPAAREPLLEYVTPVLTDVWDTAPYLHDGSAPTLLDVVRSCNTHLTDCDQRGLGRNLDDAHGRTSHLTPQQLNDLVAFLRAPHDPVGDGEGVVRAGALELATARIGFGGRPRRGRFTMIGTASPAVDLTAGGLGLTLAVPGGETMALYEVVAARDALRGKKNRVRFATRRGGAVVIALRRRRDGTLRLIARGRRVDLRALDTGARDLTVALLVGDRQFVQNRVLERGGRRRRTLALLDSTR